MEHQVVVLNAIEFAFVDKELDVFLQGRTVEERIAQLVDYGFLFIGQGIRIIRVDCREICILDGIGDAVNRDCAVHSVDRVQKQAMVKLIVRVSHYELPLEFMHDNENRLMQLCADIDFGIIVVCFR